MGYEQEHNYKEVDKIILFISENEGDVRRVERLFMDTGGMACRLHHSPGTVSALEYMANETHKVDVIILDIRLQLNADEDFYSKIKAAAPETPVLILTGESEEERAAAAPALKEGANGSINREDFTTIIQQIRFLLFGH